ncbi:hypothetical protein GF359_02070 [candidate division WOR-3 bacterium]|uniref:Xylose isomerase-like TIM barrel domain-containing protein n=1 Tax=candidate division WOR-3 bacterium TaxID=2052148 RepID=A0A9D5K8A0_UNCW3|nr:hypothetical protein [candidate division WOR-3 bacterium]MBD3363980.1 hypothetical protein [candidate division WOR-3 bacterium]
MAESTFTERCGVQVIDGYSTIAEALKGLALRDIRVVEINLNNPWFLEQLNQVGSREEIASIVKGEGVKWMAHLPEGMGFFDADEGVYQGYLKRQVELQKKAREAGCRALTAHMGAAPSFAWSGFRRPGVELFGDWYKKTLHERLQRAGELLGNSPYFSFENVGGFHLEFVRDILDRVEWGAYTMDIGHLKVAHKRIAHSEFEFYTKHLDDIKVVHVHDNDGESDQHLAVTDPDLLKPYLDLAKGSGAFLISEVRPLKKALESLATLTGIERNL